MPLDRSFIGHRYPRSRGYEVGREKIREFADAIGDPHPLYRDADAARAAGYPDVIAPPTFTATIFDLFALHDVINDPALGMRYDRMVHGDMRFAHQRPVRAGDRLGVTTHIDDITSRAGNDFLSLRVEFDTDDGESVATAYATLVVRGDDHDSGPAAP